MSKDCCNKCPDDSCHSSNNKTSQFENESNSYQYNYYIHQFFGDFNIATINELKNCIVFINNIDSIYNIYAKCENLEAITFNIENFRELNEDEIKFAKGENFEIKSLSDLVKLNKNLKNEPLEINKFLSEQMKNNYICAQENEEKFCSKYPINTHKTEDYRNYRCSNCIIKYRIKESSLPEINPLLFQVKDARKKI
jgi:hypothetical protein